MKMKLIIQIMIRTVLPVLYCTVKTNGLPTERALASTALSVNQDGATSEPFKEVEDASNMLDDDCLVELMPFNAENISEEQLGVMIRNIVVEGRTTVRGLFLETQKAAYNFAQTFIKYWYVRQYVEVPFQNSNNNRGLVHCSGQNDLSDKIQTLSCLLDVYASIKTLSLSLTSLLDSTICFQNAILRQTKETFEKLELQTHQVACTMKVNGLIQLKDLSLLTLRPIDEVHDCMTSQSDHVTTVEILRILYQSLNIIEQTTKSIIEVLASISV